MRRARQIFAPLAGGACKRRCTCDRLSKRSLNVHLRTWSCFFDYFRETGPVRPARVARNLSSENRRQGHPLLESSRTVRLVAPPQSSNVSIDRTRRASIAERWSLRSRKSVSRNSSIIVRIRQEFASRVDSLRIDCTTTSWRKESIARKVDLLVDSFHLAGNIASMNGRVHCYLRSIDRVGGGRRWTGSETEKEGNSQEWQCFEFF